MFKIIIVECLPDFRSIPQHKRFAYYLILDHITVKKIAHYDDLIDEYENPLEHACSMELGQTFICNGWEKPEGFCSSAWDTVSAFVML
ncbi:TIGR04076 family protein [Oribacterium sp. KHPX15]|uniref:TIGR04076 family protein n=1 Tax=Oribacterium sp. KHPX15 TaxID=1855342 RepID=UPI002FE58981